MKHFAFFRIFFLFVWGERTEKSNEKENASHTQYANITIFTLASSCTQASAEPRQDWYESL